MNEKETLLAAKVAQILDKPFTEVAYGMSLMKTIEELVGVIERGQVSNEGGNQ